MADRFELSYVYARVCGSLSRAFLGGKAVELAKVGRMSELWRAVFGEAAPNLPEAAVVSAAERRAVAESLSGFRELAEKLRTDEPFFAALRRKSEFARVKRVLLAVKGGANLASELPPSDDPDLEPGFDESAFPRVEAMFSGGRYSWIGDESLLDLPAAENRLDKQFYAELWNELRRVPARKAGALPRLIREEVELENAVWALRLKRYYGLGREAIEGKLIELEGVDARKDALKALDFKFDRRADWAGWAWERLIGPEAGANGGFFLDVRDFEARARRQLYRGVKRALHMHPFTYTPLYCYFKIKEYETAAIIGIIEGVHLGAPVDEMAAFAAGLTGGSA